MGVSEANDANSILLAERRVRVFGWSTGEASGCAVVLLFSVISALVLAFVAVKLFDWVFVSRLFPLVPSSLCIYLFASFVAFKYASVFVSIAAYVPVFMFDLVPASVLSFVLWFVFALVTAFCSAIWLDLTIAWVFDWLFGQTKTG